MWEKLTDFLHAHYRAVLAVNLAALLNWQGTTGMWSHWMRIRNICRELCKSSSVPCCIR